METALAGSIFQRDKLSHPKDKTGFTWPKQVRGVDLASRVSASPTGPLTTICFRSTSQIFGGIQKMVRF